MFYENNGQIASEAIKGAAGKYQFCRFCEAESSCDHCGSKLTERSSYVLRYVYEIDSGFAAYPNPGSWEHQPLWFITMLQAGRAELVRCRNEKQRIDLENARHRK